MKEKALAFCALLYCLCGAAVPGAEGAVDIGVSIGNEGLRAFYLAIGDYYKVPQNEVIVIRERRIPDDEIPVVLFIAKKARTRPEAVVDLRLKGMSWMDITLHFRFGPEIYYVPVKTVATGPPYGKAYGYYKNRPRKEWNKIVLSDDDVINLVNLRFISHHYRYAPEQVMHLRGEGKGFVVIHDDVRKEKKHYKEKKEYKEKKGKDEHKGKG